MGTQFILSLLGGGIAGAGLLWIGGTYAYRWYKKEELVISGEKVAIVAILLSLGAVSAYKLAEASFHYAKVGTHAVIEGTENGVNTVLDAGQSAISGTIKYFSVAILEGVGQTYEHFEEKWDREKVDAFKNLELRVVSVKKILKEDKTLLILDLEITNIGAKSINFNELITHQLLLMKSKNDAYSAITFNGEVDSQILISPATTIRKKFQIYVQGENIPTMLSTPTQNLELK